MTTSIRSDAGGYRYSLTSIDAILTLGAEPAGTAGDQSRDDRRSGVLAVALTALIVTVVLLVSLFVLYRLAVGIAIIS